MEGLNYIPLICLLTMKSIFLKSLLKQNGYPLSLIEETINKVLRKLYIPFETKTSVKQDVPKEVI